MKARTEDFKNQIKLLGREIDFKIYLHTNDKIITEDGKFLMTQSNLNLIVEQFNEEEIDEIITAEDIYNVSIVNKGKLLSAIMKEFDFEVKQDLRVGDVVDCSFGLKVGEDYEYIDYGRYVIYSKEHNEDTNTYSYVAFDGMLLSMVDMSDRTIIENVTIKKAIENICEKVGLTVNITSQDITDFPNLSQTINEDTFKDIEMTYRDVLDMICQCLGISMITNNKELQLKPLNNTPVDSFDEFYLKDTNVKFGKKYGPVNSIVLSRSDDNDNIYRRDEKSISENGLCEYKIKDNLIMLGNDREYYIDEIYNQLHGLEFYINDFTSTGITYLDILDFYNITIGDTDYKCLLLNDEIKIDQGLEETIYTEEPEETTTDYKTSSKTDKEVSFIVDKQRGSINAKVSKGDVINEINLDETGATINANKVDIQASDVLNILAGNTINLTSKNIKIDSNNFSVDEYGNMSANNVSLNSGLFKGELNTSQNCKVGDNLYVGQNQSSAADNIKYIYLASDGYIRRWTMNNKSYMRMNGDYQLNLTTDSSYIYLFGDGYNGITMSTTPSYGSDKRLKDKIKNIDVDWIDDLKVKEYEYKNSPNKKHIGLIAQDYIDKDYSKYFLTQDTEGYYSINYNDITNGLIQYCQELKQQVNKLEERLEALENKKITEDMKESDE